MSEKKINLENCQFTKKHRINSPRSLQALNELGIGYDSLIKETLENFISKNEDAKNLPKEILQKRYEHFENKKEELISKAIEKRQKIIDSQKKDRKKRTNDNLSQSQLNKTKTEENENKENKDNENKENENNENYENENKDNDNNENKDNENNESENNENDNENNEATAIKNQRLK